MAKTRIGWTDYSWNPVTGCSKISPGCRRCYASAIAEPKRGLPSFPNGFDITLRPHKLKEPAKWKEPSLIFVNSMSDTFHRDIPDSYLVEIWQTMLDVDHHIYQVLTKRPHRMAEKIRALGLPTPAHIWLGTSVESQKFADNRIPALLSIAGESLRWISAEPLLGAVDVRQYQRPQFDQDETGWHGNVALDWVVDGGESGPGRTLAEYDWFRSLRDQCFEETAYLHKQGNHLYPGRDRELDGRTWDELPFIDHPAIHRKKEEFRERSTEKAGV